MLECIHSSRVYFIYMSHHHKYFQKRKKQKGGPSVFNNEVYVFEQETGAAEKTNLPSQHV